MILFFACIQPFSHEMSYRWFFPEYSPQKHYKNPQVLQDAALESPSLLFHSVNIAAVLFAGVGQYQPDANPYPHEDLLNVVDNTQKHLINIIYLRESYHKFIYMH